MPALNVMIGDIDMVAGAYVSGGEEKKSRDIVGKEG